LHVHSAWSYDAELALDDVAALFRRHHYDAVFMCEHDRGFTVERLRTYVAACEEASSMGTLLVPGIEYADANDLVHVPVWGSVPFLGEGIPTTRLLQEVAEHDGVSVIAHPLRRNAWEIVTHDWLQMCTGVEIWTRKWDGWAPNRRACQWAADAGLVGVAALDLHRPGQMFPLAMEMEIAGPLSVEACVDAFRQGRCRAIIGGLPAAPLTSGALAGVARTVEQLRRPVWRSGRLIRERLSGAH
jgi:predicted metal-dependent phosphoesterase TrpH